jgi:hypothetical protein
LFSKILPTFVLGISCLTVWICQIKFYALILFLFGGSSLSVIWLYVIWIFHLLYGGLNKLPEMNVRMHRM